MSTLRRVSSWENTIHNQRDKLAKLLKKMPSLLRMLEDPEWDQEVGMMPSISPVAKPMCATCPKSANGTSSRFCRRTIFPPDSAA